MGEEATAPEWTESIEDEGLKTSLGQFETVDDFYAAAKIEKPEAVEIDWRESLKDEDMKKSAERFGSVEDILRSNADMRKRDSQVRIPGKDASDEEKAKYHAAIGVPENAEAYKFPEKENMTDEEKASNDYWKDIFHGTDISQKQADDLMEGLKNAVTKNKEANIKANEQWAEDSSAALKESWRGDYDKNVAIANQGFNKFFETAGIDVDDIRSIKMENGLFLMDDARFLQGFATLGREMGEGTLGPAMNEDEVETMQGEIDNLRAQIEEAQSKGDSKRANSLFAKEQALISKMSGNKPAVGASGRTV